MNKRWSWLLLAMIAFGCRSGSRACRPQPQAMAIRQPPVAMPQLAASVPSDPQVERIVAYFTNRTTGSPSAMAPNAKPDHGRDARAMESPQPTSRRTKPHGPELAAGRSTQTALASRRQQAGATDSAETVPAPTSAEPPLPPGTSGGLRLGEPSPSASARIALGLGDALETGLTQNPALITLRGTANVSAAAARVARIYPWNPFVQSQFFPNGTPFVPSSTPGGGAGGSNYYVWAMQRIELAHQTRHRAEGASAALGQVRWNIRQAELLNVAITERLFFTALYQRQLQDLASDTAVLNQRLLEVVNRRYKAGLATPAEATNARVAARQSRRQSQLAEAAYEAALLGLRQQLAVPLDMPLDADGDLRQFEWFPAPSAVASITRSASAAPRQLAAEVIETRPDVLAARAGISVARANLDLARAARIQDIQAGPIYETADDGTRYLGFRLQRDFGVWNNGGALARQRGAEVQQQALTYEQLKRQAAIEAQVAMDRYERARQFVAEAAADFTDRTPAELKDMAAQFEAGQADILNVLAIQNNLLQDERTYLDLLNELAQSAATVTLATGVPPERLMSPGRADPNP